jgi:hypothetical protein
MNKSNFLKLLLFARIVAAVLMSKYTSLKTSFRPFLKK